MSIKNYLLFLLIIPFTINAQNRKEVDSLKNLLTQNISVEQEFEVYRRLCYAFNYNDNIKAKIYLDSLAAIAKRSANISNFTGLALKHKGMYYNTISDYSTAEKEYIKAIVQFEKKGETEYKHRSLLALSDVQRKLGK